MTYVDILHKKKMHVSAECGRSPLDAHCTLTVSMFVRKPAMNTWVIMGVLRLCKGSAPYLMTSLDGDKDLQLSALPDCHCDNENCEIL